MKNKNFYVLWIIFATVSIFIIVLILVNAYNDLHNNDTNPITNQNVYIEDKITIVLSFGGIDYNDNIKNQVSLFMDKNPEIEVKILQLPNSTDYQRNSYVSAFKAGDTSIDVLFTDIIWTAEFASNNWVLPLENYFTEEKQSKFIQSAINGCRYNGTIYAVPKRSDAPFLYYRKDIIPHPPVTYDEMIEQVQRFKPIYNIKYGYVFQGNTYEGLVCNALEYIWGYGGDVIRDGNVVINSPESRQGLQKLVDIVNSDISSPDVLTFIEEDSMLAFQDGNALFMRNWPGSYNQLNVDNSPVKGKVGICELPYGSVNGFRSAGTLGGWNYMINRNSKHPNESWKLIEWLTSYDMQVLDNKTGGNPPTRIQVYLNEELKQNDPTYSIMYNLIENARLRPISPSYPIISESMQLNFSAALRKDIDVETALTNIDKDLRDIMASDRH